MVYVVNVVVQEEFGVLAVYVVKYGAQEEFGVQEEFGILEECMVFGYQAKNRVLEAQEESVAAQYEVL